jgi:hypothetical protein
VKVALPGGTQGELYFDYAESPTCGIYRTMIFEAPQSGTHTITAVDRDENTSAVAETVEIDPLGYPGNGSLSAQVTGTAVEFAWDAVDGAAFHRLEIFDGELEKVYDFSTVVNGYSLPAGFLLEGTPYHYRVKSYREYLEENLDNGSAAPWSPAISPVLVTAPLSGSQVPALDLDNHGVALLNSVNPLTGNTAWWLTFRAEVTDGDGVPVNIAEVYAEDPAGKRFDLRFDEEMGPDRAGYRGGALFGDLADIAAGTYTFHAVDVEGGDVTATDDLVVDSLPLPVYGFPEDGAVVAATAPFIAWEEVAGAAGYTVEIFTGVGETVHESEFIEGTGYAVPYGILEEGPVYSYRIFAFGTDPEEADLDSYSVTRIFTAAMPHFTLGEAPELTRGDVNDDGSVDLLDALIVLRLVAGFANDKAFGDADVDGDGMLGMGDALFILQATGGVR